MNIIYYYKKTFCQIFIKIAKNNKIFSLIFYNLFILF